MDHKGLWCYTGEKGIVSIYICFEEKCCHIALCTRFSISSHPFLPLSLFHVNIAQHIHRAVCMYMHEAVSREGKKV